MQGDLDLIVPPGDRSKPNPRMGDSKAGAGCFASSSAASIDPLLLICYTHSLTGNQRQLRWFCDCREGEKWPITKQSR